MTWGERERNVLFNDALNTFYLRLYGVRHMVKDHSDSEKGNPLSPHRLLLYHGLCYTSRGSLAGTRNSSMKDRSDDPPHHERTLYLWATSRSHMTWMLSHSGLFRHSEVTEPWRCLMCRCVESDRYHITSKFHLYGVISKQNTGNGNVIFEINFTIGG